MKVLGIAPKFEEITSHSIKWFEKLVDEIKDKVSVVELKEKEAVREKFEETIRKNDFDIIIFYDHGEADRLIGNDRRPVVDKKNIHLLKNKVLYTMACLSARELGKEHFKNNGIFWGYDEEFVFTEEEEELFERCANAGIKYVLQGYTWEEAYKKTIEEFNKAMKEARLLWTKIWLQHDRDALRLYSKNSPPREDKSLTRRIKRKIKKLCQKLSISSIHFLHSSQVAA